MKPITLQNYAEGRWVAGLKDMAELRSAVNGEVVALTSSQGLDFGAMAKFAREKGGSALRALTFHERAKLLKALAEALTARKEELYELSYNTGATRADSWIDIDGGIATFGVYQGKGRRELPNDTILIDGNVEGLSRNGTFQGLHVFTSLQGVAVHINAFNFPVWGMLEKLAPAFLAGAPAIVKPASATSYLTEAAVRIMLEANVLPAGRAAIGGRLDRRSLRSSHIARRRLVHRLGADGGETEEPSGDRARERAFRGRAGLAQRLGARPRRHRGCAGV